MAYDEQLAKRLWGDLWGQVLHQHIIADSALPSARLDWGYVSRRP